MLLGDLFKMALVHRRPARSRGRPKWRAPQAARYPSVLAALVSFGALLSLSGALGGPSPVLLGAASRGARLAAEQGQRPRPERLLAAAVLDDFEAPHWPDPFLWRLPADTTPMWWPSSCQAHRGRRALWAFGGPTLRGEQACDAAAPPGTSNDLVLNLDLRDTRLASRLELYFALWLKMPAGDGQGLFIHLLVPRAGGGYDRVPVFGATGTAGQWTFPLRQLDLLALADTRSPDRVYDLRGGYWRLEWTAYAPYGTPPGGGIFIDDLTLVWEPDPAVATPTLRPWPTETAAPTLTATSSPSATRPPATASPTLPPTPLCLPWLARDHPEATPTATETATPTAEPSPQTLTPTPEPLPTTEPG